jgi:hypothetical protein
MTPIDNPELKLAHQFIQDTGQNIFLTGKAGTGKTTFLKTLRQQTPKRMIVVAPTGVAAINAGGVTIHSFFQMPFGPHLPLQITRGGNNTHLMEKFPAGHTKINREKINIIKSLDLLVIDEISMVRADLLDGVDEILRRYRQRNKPFGGVQLLMIGDIQQLPPVVKDEEWQLLKPYYHTLFFFGSKALEQAGYISLELKHIYRQSDNRFINILNKIRNNNLDNQSLTELNQRHIPNFNPDDREGYITLTTHNSQAQLINQSKLTALPTKIITTKAVVKGDFPEYAFPTDQDLKLKEGAQVMFVKNDTSREKLYFNGKIGTIISIEQPNGETVVKVKCPDDSQIITVTPVEWQNIKFSINDESKEIEETEVGSFLQIPLKPAWAITIHKSQGLTFEKAIIDAQSAFAHGQVYVALSRCKSLEGLVLSRPISSTSIKNDQTIASFSAQVETHPPTTEQLQAAKKQYQYTLLWELFDLSTLHRHLMYFLRVTRENQELMLGKPTEAIDAILQYLQQVLMTVNDKFAQQLHGWLHSGEHIETSPILTERIGAASDYFASKLDAHILQPLQSLPIETDNKAIRKKVTEPLERVLSETITKIAGFMACKSGFDTHRYLTAKAKAAIEIIPAKTREKNNRSEALSNLPHAELFNRLRIWRNNLANSAGVPVYTVLPQKSLLTLVHDLPCSLQQLKTIKGLGTKRIDSHGTTILKIIRNYCEEQNIHQPEDTELQSLPKPEKVDTKKISFDLFESGKTIAEIAKERQLTISTIEGHLAYFIENGTIEASSLMDAAKLDVIIKTRQQNPDARLSELKAALGDDFTYGDLQIAMAHLKQKTRQV